MPRVWNRRRKGVPGHAIHVYRPGYFGNPFDTAAEFEEWAMKPEQAEYRAKARELLRGKDLVCWCAPKPCHADILLRIANEEED
jgi:hypothetical protein